MTIRRDTGRSAVLGWAGLGVAALILLIPVLIAPVPPLSDYPNHLARMWMLSSAAAAVSVSQFYHVQFDTFTNIAIDLIALTVGKLGGYELAGRVSIAAAVLLPAVGGAMLWRALYGRLHWWMLSFGLLVWGQSLLAAFLNFQIALGLALLFAALDPMIERRSPVIRVAARAALGLVLMVAHPFGFIFYGLLVAALILGPRVGRSAAAWRDTALRWAVAFAGLVLVLVLFVVTVPQLPGAQEHSGLGTLGAEFWFGIKVFLEDKTFKILNLFLALRTYDNRFDLLTGLLLAAPIALAALKRCLHVHAGLALLSAALVVIYFLCPNFLLGAGWVSARFAVMFAFTLAAAVDPALPALAGRFGALVLAATLVARTAFIGVIWQERQVDVASLASALSVLPEGSSVLPLEQRPQNKSTAPLGRYTTLGESGFRHLPALAVPWRHAFIPTIFSARGKQPLIVLPPWSDISDANGGPAADVHGLDATPPAGSGSELITYLPFWRTRFDYVLLLGGDTPDKYGAFVPPPNLSLVRDAGFARLYRIAPPP